MGRLPHAWRRAPRDPDPVADLGYDLVDLDVVSAADDAALVVLPADEDHLRGDAFAVVDPAAVCDLTAMR